MRTRSAVLAALLAACPLAAPSLAGAAPRHNHGLTIAAAPDPIIAGDGVIIYGRLLGSNVAGQTINLYHRVKPNHRFTVIGHTTTNSNGYYEFTREEGVVMSNRSWFVRGPDKTHSRTVAERVAALVTLFASATSTDTATPVTFSGKVTPGHAGNRVLLQAQPDGSSAWYTIKTGRLAGDSTYTLTHRWASAGVRNVRVVFTGDRRNVRSASDATTVTVQQAQRPGFTIASSAPVISYGQGATLSGVLDQPGTSTPAGGVSVTLFGRPADSGHFTAVGATATASDGSYSFAVSPVRNEVFYVRETLDRKVRTAPLYEAVHDVISLSTSSATSTVGGEVTLSGDVLPGKSGEWVYLQRLGRDGAWHSVAADRLNRASHYSFTRSFGSAGTKHFRARIYGDRRNAGDVSPAVTVTVSGTAPASSLPPAS